MWLTKAANPVTRGFTNDRACGGKENKQFNPRCLHAQLETVHQVKNVVARNSR